MYIWHISLYPRLMKPKTVVIVEIGWYCGASGPSILKICALNFDKTYKLTL